MTFRYLVFLAAICLITSGAACQANMLINGDFEQIGTEWTLDVPYGALDLDGHSSSDGSDHCLTSCFDVMTASQSVAIEPGFYSLYLSAYFRIGYSSQDNVILPGYCSLSLLIDGNEVAGRAYYADEPGDDPRYTDWIQGSLSWSGHITTDATVRIGMQTLITRLYANIPDIAPPKVDDVSLTAVSVPEPTCFITLIIGLTGTIAFSRQQKQ